MQPVGAPVGTVKARLHRGRTALQAIDVDTELGSYLDEQERTVVAPLTEALCRVESVCD